MSWCNTGASREYPTTADKGFEMATIATPIVTREEFEQLRALAHGIGIKVNIVSREAVKPNFEVDTPEDLDNATRYARENGL